MEILITILYVLVCLFLILVVLLQSGKAGDLAATFGGVSSQTALGSRGTANFLSRATSWSAAFFLIFALLLAMVHSEGTGSVLEEAEEAAGAAAPAPVETTAEPASEDGAPPAADSEAGGDATGSGETDPDTGSAGE